MYIEGILWHLLNVNFVFLFQNLWFFVTKIKSQFILFTIPQLKCIYFLYTWCGHNNATRLLKRISTIIFIESGSTQDAKDTTEEEHGARHEKQKCLNIKRHIFAYIETISTRNLQSFHICERRGNALVHGVLSCEKAAEYWVHMQELSLDFLYWLC